LPFLENELRFGVYPNPTSNNTIISFSLSQSQKISFQFFDVDGRLVSTLAEKIFAEGENEVSWEADGIDAGIYFLKINTGKFTKAEKIILTK